MTPNLRLAKIFWCIATAFALCSALAGIINRDIYYNLFPKEFLPGAYPQDIMTVIVCLGLFYLIASVKEQEIRKQVLILGLIGSLFYLYGIFTIERVYNWCYLLYAATFAASFWSLVYGLSGFRRDKFTGLRIRNTMLKTTAISSIVIALLFTGLWSAALIPLMRDHNRIEYLYSIYILDLCFIMPAFFITGVMSLRGSPLGILAAPAIMILGFFVIFPLGLNELAKPSAGMPIETGPMMMSFLFAAFMLVVAIVHLRMLKINTI
jgi:hypothetical protein